MDLSVDHIDRNFTRKRTEGRKRDFHNNDSFISDNGDVGQKSNRSVSPLTLKYYESHMHNVIVF
jgi:hypothetical protein